MTWETSPMPTAPPVIEPGRLTPGRGVGVSELRSDGIPKTRGEFLFASDLGADDMLWGATARSKVPAARIVRISTEAAAALPGVLAVLTQADVPGRPTFGLELPDQPVLAFDEIRYQGEPYAIVAANHPETARRAAALVEIELEELDPVATPETALAPDARAVHPGGNVLRHIQILHGPQEFTADVVVRGHYEVGMQDQAFLGPESGLAVPDGVGGVDLYVATQFLHVDQQQVCACLDLPPDQVRLTLGGVGGAFGGREDLSMQIHACMLALATGRPVKMVYNRTESFVGHVHRHPAWMEYEHGADRDGMLRYVRCSLILDGGAYASSSSAVISNAACFALGPYNVPTAEILGDVLYSNNPPCGAMRGFGAVQTCFAHEGQMDRLAAALGIDPLELRIRNAISEGSVMPTGQIVEGPAPARELLEGLRNRPLPTEDAVLEAAAGGLELRRLPGGVGNTTHGEDVVRGIGYAIGFKNVGFSEGFDDYSTARVRIEEVGGTPRVSVHTAAAEVGQGGVTIQAQIARTELGVEDVTILPQDTSIGSAGSTSASRQTYMTGGAVMHACWEVRSELFARAAKLLGQSTSNLVLLDGAVQGGAEPIPLVRLLEAGPVEATFEFHHRPTRPLDPETGQGDAHLQFAFAAHRAVVDVDRQLGLVRIVEMATTQDVGKMLNPLAVEGQISGGIAQGVGLALMEEIQLSGGRIRNPSFTDYLIPTILDMPPVELEIFECADPEAPYGLRGVGEPPTISSTPAIVSAVRAATGRELTRVPLRPEQIVGV